MLQLFKAFRKCRGGEKVGSGSECSAGGDAIVKVSMDLVLLKG